MYNWTPTRLRNWTDGVQMVGLEDSGRFTTERLYPASENKVPPPL